MVKGLDNVLERSVDGLVPYFEGRDIKGENTTRTLVVADSNSPVFLQGLAVLNRTVGSSTPEGHLLEVAQKVIRRTAGRHRRALGGLNVAYHHDQNMRAKRDLFSTPYTPSTGRNSMGELEEEFGPQTDSTIVEIPDRKEQKDPTRLRSPRNIIHKRSRPRCSLPLRFENLGLRSIPESCTTNAQTILLQ